MLYRLYTAAQITIQIRNHKYVDHLMLPAYEMISSSMSNAYLHNTSAPSAQKSFKVSLSKASGQYAQGVEAHSGFDAKY